MSSLFRRVVDTVSEWFGPPATKSTVSKKFEINGSEQLPRDEARHSGKTFSVTGEHDVGVTAGRAPGGRFGVAGTTRPKRCPRCGTMDNMTRDATRRWECRTCEYRWR